MPSYTPIARRGGGAFGVTEPGGGPRAVRSEAHGARTETASDVRLGPQQGEPMSISPFARRDDPL